MRVGVGYSELPESALAGKEAVEAALKEAGRKDKCDFALLFATSRHDAPALRASVVSALGFDLPIVGGGSVGAISNAHFGYAGDQIILALFWLDGLEWNLLVRNGLTEGKERQVGGILGKVLASQGVKPETPVILFYDAIDQTKGDMRMVMATYILQGLREELGFLPDLVGAGMQGDYINTPTMQYRGEGIGLHNALALSFDEEVRMDTVIMHGCRPATGYYTVTKVDKQTILEINGRPAIEFLDSALGPVISPESYPFSLILGMNRSDKWGDFNENSYANRLCLGLDAERGGIVMFEPDMVEGTEFQVMYRTSEPDYIPPRIEKLFDDMRDREPVFALYINCAGRAAGYGGADLEDASAVQAAVAGRAPLLGIYTGVEIGPVEGQPRGLDWTGVFCLFSVPK